MHTPANQRFVDVWGVWASKMHCQIMGDDCKKAGAGSHGRVDGIITYHVLARNSNMIVSPKDNEGGNGVWHMVPKNIVARWKSNSHETREVDIMEFVVSLHKDLEKHNADEVLKEATNGGNVNYTLRRNVTLINLRP